MSSNIITYTHYVFTFTVLICAIGFAVWWECYGAIITAIQLPPVERNYPPCPLKGQVRCICAPHPSCTSTCSLEPFTCTEFCSINGCGCPISKVLNKHRNECISLSQCPDNRKQSAQEKELTIFNKKLEEVHTGYGSNIFFSVKTCNRLYRKRLFYQMLTWFQAVDKNKLSIVSDDPNAAADDVALIKRSGFNLLLSNCEPSHDLYSLCCKSAAEFSMYYRELDKHKNEEDKYQWYCHFDDDMYVNIPAMGKLLEQYDPHQPYYIGRWPKEVWGPMPRSHTGLNQKELDNIASFNYTVRRRQYWYAGGCGYCLSHAVMMEARRILLGDVNYCKVTLNTDDVSVGIVVGAILGINLTDIDEIHSQRENLSLSSLEQTMNYVTVSANRLVNLKTPFSDDKYGFMALHCLLYPSVSWCQHQKIVTQT